MLNAKGKKGAGIGTKKKCFAFEVAQRSDSNLPLL